jgi:AcrR family transcriptional regulator
MDISDTRSIIFEAASDLISREGVSNFTLEAVAREAGISKGGLLYHFASKRKLIEGLIESQLDKFEAQVEAERISQPPGPGRWLRAYIKASAKAPTKPGYSTGIIAILATEPDLFENLRSRYSRWQDKLDQDGLDHTVATLARMAMDGLRFYRIIGISPDTERQERAIEYLLHLTETQELAEVRLQEIRE